MIARSGVSAGFAGGALLALYPNQLVRSAVVECIVIIVLGGVGALIAGRWGERSLVVAVASAVITSFGVVMWVVWQNGLGAPVSVGAIAAVWGVATLTPSALAAVPRRTRLAVLGTSLLASTLVISSGTAAAGVPTSPAMVFEAIDSGDPGVRVYEPLGSESVEVRAERAVQHLVESGGLEMRAIVVTLPTGSGWVDARFVRGAEQALDGKVAILAMQYTQMRSWEAYLFHRSAVQDAAVALVDALDRTLPENAPPVYFYGQSLGALGVDAALERAEHLDFPVTGSLLAGPPASVGDRAAVRLVNSSDPVVVWGLDLAVQPPRELTGCVLAGQPTPTPPWAPMASFLQASVDLLLANDNPPGLGHRYDERQGTELFGKPRTCG